MTVLCVESGITYATGVAAIAAEGGANRTMQVSGSNSFATSVNAGQYNLGIVIIPNPGEETQDDGDINIGAQMTGAFSCAAPNSEIRDLRTNNLNLTSAPNMTIDGLICDGLGSDGVIYNDTVIIRKLIIHNADDSLISSATRPNSDISGVTSVGAARFGFANGKFNNCVDVNSANQGYFGEMTGSGNLWEHDGSGTNTITESPVTDVFVDFAAGKYGILASSSPGVAGAGGFIFTASSGITVTAERQDYSLTFNDATVDLTGEVLVSAESQLYQVQFFDGQVDLIAGIDVLAQTQDYDITFFDATVQLSGVINVSAGNQLYSVTFYDASVSITELWTDKPKAVTNWGDKSNVVTIWTDK